MAPTPPSYSESNILVTFPLEHVLQITMNRPKTMNAMTSEMRDDIARVMDWFETERILWVVILTGSGRAFCSGMDLRAWAEAQSTGTLTNFEEVKDPATRGVGSISKRRSKKPIIAAVNGFAIGGGLEMVLNCDLVVASEDATFGFPEVGRGVLVAAGGVPRLFKLAGHQLAAEVLLLGKNFGAKEARDRYRFINVIVPPSEVIPTALGWAATLVSNAPDAVQSNKRGIVSALHVGGCDDANTDHILSPETQVVFEGENILEGLRSFTERRPPRWLVPKL